MLKLKTKEVITLPNLLSLYRLIISFVIPVLWVLKVKEEVIYLLIISGVLSDTLDGNLARLLKQKTALGKALDPLADKCFINMLFFLFYLEKRVTFYFFAIILLRDLGILLGGLILLKRGIDLRNLSPTLLGKTSTVFQLLTLVLLFTTAYIRELPNSLLKAFLNLTLFFTSASGFHYFLTFKRLFYQSPIYGKTS